MFEWEINPDGSLWLWRGPYLLYVEFRKFGFLWSVTEDGEPAPLVRGIASSPDAAIEFAEKWADGFILSALERSGNDDL